MEEKHANVCILFRFTDSVVKWKQLSQVCNSDIKFYGYTCYFGKFDITRERFLVNMLHQTFQFVCKFYNI